MSEDKNEQLRPSKMRGVAFPKAKYGAILAVIIIIVVNLIFYKDFKRLFKITSLYLWDSQLR